MKMALNSLQHPPRTTLSSRPFHDVYHVYPYAQVILVTQIVSNAKLHPILSVECPGFEVIRIFSSKVIPHATRVASAVASPASGYPWAPTMARGLQPNARRNPEVCHECTRAAGDVPDGNNALWSSQNFLSRMRQPWVHAFPRKRDMFMCPSLYVCTEVPERLQTGEDWSLTGWRQAFTGAIHC